MDLFKDAAAEGLKAIPPVAVSAVTLHDKLDDTVLGLTAVYLLLQIAFMLRKHTALRKKKHDSEEIDPIDIRRE